MSLDEETTGSLFDSFLHKLSFASKLVTFLRERFQIAFDSFFNVGKGFFAIVALADRALKFNTLGGIAALRLLPEYNRELFFLNFHHKSTSIRDLG
jgi:hypothetical protein